VCDECAHCDKKMSSESLFTSGKGKDPNWVIFCGDLLPDDLLPWNAKALKSKKFKMEFLSHSQMRHKHLHGLSYGNKMRDNLNEREWVISKLKPIGLEE
jgi:hypothetical protein